VHYESWIPEPVDLVLEVPTIFPDGSTVLVFWRAGNEGQDGIMQTRSGFIETVATCHPASETRSLLCICAPSLDTIGAAFPFDVFSSNTICLVKVQIVESRWLAAL
jgi:hypothetical protein